MKPKAPIVARYDMHARALESDKMALFASDDELTHISRLVPEHFVSWADRLLSSEKSFFSKFDYDWIRCEQNFRNHLEWILQLYLLETLCDVTEAHPHYSVFGDICIRIVATADMNGESFTDGAYKFITISTSYVKYIKEFMVSFNEIQTTVKIKKRFIFGPSNSARVRRLHNAILNKIDDCIPILERLFHVIASYTSYSIPEILSSPLTSIHSLGSPTERQLEFSMVMVGVDVFLILHELGHLLTHQDAPLCRSHKEELEADKAACSLFTVCCSRNSALGGAFVLAPAIFFASFRLFNLCRRTLKHVAHLAQKDYFGDFDVGQELLADRSLQERALAYAHHLHSWGLPAHVAESYHQQFALYDLITFAMQIFLEKCFLKDDKLGGRRRRLDRRPGLRPNKTGRNDPCPCGSGRKYKVCCGRLH